MFEIFGPIFEQNAHVIFEPIFEQNVNSPIFEKNAKNKHSAPFSCELSDGFPLNKV